MDTPKVNNTEVYRFFDHTFLIEGQVVSFKPFSNEHPLYWISAPLAMEMIQDDRFRSLAVFDKSQDKIDWQAAFESLVCQVAEQASLSEEMWGKMLSSVRSHLYAHPNTSLGHFLALAEQKRENFILDPDDIDDDTIRAVGSDSKKGPSH